MPAAVGARNLFKVNAGVVHALLQVRHQNSGRGQFISEDPVFLAVGNPGQIKQLVGRDQQTLLANPQALNSYSYAQDNPITASDPRGLRGPETPFEAAFATPAGFILGFAGQGVKSDPFPLAGNASLIVSADATNTLSVVTTPDGLRAQSTFASSTIMQ
jgi:hypothetical protein